MGGLASMSILTKKVQGQMYKGQLVPISLKLFQNMEEEEKLHNAFYEDIILIPKTPQRKKL